MIGADNVGAVAAGGSATALDDRSEWHAWRAHGIGASDVAGIVGLSRYGSPWKVWAEKVGLLAPTETTPRQRVGQLLEPAIATLFHETTGLHVLGEQTWCQHHELPWARATVDGFVAESPNAPSGDLISIDDLLGTHQIKTDGRFGWPDGVPPDIRAQCVWEMAVCGLGHCWLSVLHAGFRYEIYEIPWDADAEADWLYLRDAAAALWQHVLTGDPPPVDGSDATAEALARVFPDHDPGERVSLDELVAELAERSDLREDRKRIDDRLKVIDNMIREAFGTAELGTVAGVPLLSYRTSARKGYVVQPTTVRTLRAASKRDLEAM